MDTQTPGTSEQSTMSPNVTDNSHDDVVRALPNHGVMELKHEIAEEVRSILQVVAATGKFWHDWEKLKSMLSFHLKQVLSEYPEAKMTSDQQNSTLGETYPELAKRLDDALLSFIEGPPFTLQRLSEILLDARSMYPYLSKLALALEKNLLVTSTLTISTDQYPPAMIKTSNEPDKGTENSQPLSEQPLSEDPHLQSDPVQNGVEPMIADKDEIMAEVEADVNDDMTIDMVTFEEIVKSSETSSMPTSNL